MEKESDPMILVPDFQKCVPGSEVRYYPAAPPQSQAYPGHAPVTLRVPLSSLVPMRKRVPSRILHSSKAYKF